MSGNIGNELLCFASTAAYEQELADALDLNLTRILSFKSPNKKQKIVTKKSDTRYVPKWPEFTIDTPDLIDDPLCNLLDWSCNDELAVALINKVWLCLCSTQERSFFEIEEDKIGSDFVPVMSVRWAPDGRHLAIGLSSGGGGGVKLFDILSEQFVRENMCRDSWIGSLDWRNDSVLTSGDSLNGLIVDIDMRVKSGVVVKYKGHEGGVCNLKWSPSGNKLASGGIDKILHVWDGYMPFTTTALHKWNAHNAVVKAISWCPFQSNLLASGGDHCIKFWDTFNGERLDSVDTGSQVCCLLWNKHNKELLSSHGDGNGTTKNHLTLWNYPSMLKVTELSAHSNRVLFMAPSPDGYSVTTASPQEETVKIWKNVFGTPHESKNNKRGPVDGSKRGLFSDFPLISLADLGTLVTYNTSHFAGVASMSILMDKECCMNYRRFD